MDTDLGVNDVIEGEEPPEEVDKTADSLGKIADTLAGTKDDYDALNKKYSSLQGVFNSQKKQMETLEQQISGLTDQNTVLMQALNPKQAQDVLSPDEADAIKNTRPIIEKIVNSGDASMFDQINTKLEETQNQFQTSLREESEKNFKNAVAMAHPDLQDVLRKPEFAEYKMQQIPLANRTVGELLLDAETNLDASHAIRIIQGFKDTTKSETPDAEIAPSAASVQEDVAKPKVKESVYHDAFDKRHKTREMSQEEWTKFKDGWAKLEDEGRILYGQ